MFPKKGGNEGDGMVSDLFGAFCGRQSACGHFAGAEEMGRKAVFTYMAVCAVGRCSAGMVVPVSVKVPALDAVYAGKTDGAEDTAYGAELTGTEQPAPMDTVEAPAEEILLVTEETALPSIPWWDVLAVIWVLGALGSLGYRLTGYFRFSRNIRRTGEPMELDGVPKGLQVRKTTGGSFTYGHGDFQTDADSAGNSPDRKPFALCAAS